jgi:putative transposase
MRQKRFISPSAEKSSAVYHCISRVVDRQFKFGPKEKDVFVQMMREYEAFCEVQVLAFCVMSNHFHVLVEVPPKQKDEAVAMTDEAFLAKIKAMYSPLHYMDVEQMLERFRESGSDTAALELKAKYTCRMHDLSEFMKGLKQRFTQWFNSHHGRRGTLWEGRFKSVLVQDGYAVRVMAAYIDLNPIRAAMVQKPEDYKWCSYGEAARPKNNKLARAGLYRVLGMNQKNAQKSEDSLPMIARYRMMLFSDGEEVFTDKPEIGEVNQRVRKGFKRKRVKEVLARGGKLTLGETLRCRVRYFSDGMTVGSRDFVDDLFKSSRERFSEKRKTGARPMRGVGWKKKQSRLYSMRQLSKDSLG